MDFYQPESNGFNDTKDTVSSAIALLGPIQKVPCDDHFLPQYNARVQRMSHELTWFATTYSATKRLGYSLLTMKLDQRHALKLALLKDVKLIVEKTANDIADTKLFDGAPLPSDPDACCERADEMIGEFEQKIEELRERIYFLEQMKKQMLVLKANANGIRCFDEQIFTCSPDPNPLADGM